MEWIKLPLPALAAGGLLWLAGCQSVPPTAPNKVATVALPALERKFTARPAVPVTVQPGPTPPPAVIIPPPVVETRAPVAPEGSAPVRRPPEARISLANGRFISVTDDEWRAVPVKNASHPNNPPSLLEDAMITSTLHTRLKTLLITRDAAIQCRTTSGKVSLKAATLTPGQAVTALEQALSFDKVQEVCLSAHISG